MFYKFLGFDISNKDDSEGDVKCLFLGNIGVFEEFVVEVGDVDDGEDGEIIDDDGLEEEFVCVDIFEDGEFVFVVGVEVEYGVVEGFEFLGRN